MVIGELGDRQAVEVRGLVDGSVGMDEPRYPRQVAEPDEPAHRSSGGISSDTDVARYREVSGPALPAGVRPPAEVEQHPQVGGTQPMIGTGHQGHE
jgi:hypothetical protein